MEEADITCSICKQTFPIGDQVEASSAGSWSCGRHGSGAYGPDRFNLIRRIVARWRTQHESLGEMVLREIVQNADDAGAELLVLRFEPDALYISNDGHAFRTGTGPEDPGDFERIGRWFGYHKAEDKESTGNFGSGFLTVYLLTNAPEIHSNGRSAVMDPIAGKMTYMEPGSTSWLASPHCWQEKSNRKGALFRLPWRDESAAQMGFPGRGSPFSNAEEFPRWGEGDRRRLFQDLLAYAPEVLLCCRGLVAIRLVWASAGNPEAFQARRDFTLANPFEGPKIATVTTGPLEARGPWYDWPASRRSEGRFSKQWASFQRGFAWKGKPEASPYFIVSDVARDSAGRPLFVGKDARRSDGRLCITTDPDHLKGGKEEKRNDLYLLLPLRDVTHKGQGGKRALLYSTIPLPRRSPNWFIFSGTFFPDESRIDVDVQGVAGEWYRTLVQNVGRMFCQCFAKFVATVQERANLEDEERQRTLLNATPAGHLGRWMRPDEPDPSWAEADDQKVTASVIQAPIVRWNDQWIPPQEATWVDLDPAACADARQVLATMGVPSFSEVFTAHPSFKGSLSGPLEYRKLSPEGFLRFFESFLERSRGTLYYGRSGRGGQSLNRKEIDALLRFCLIRTGKWANVGSLPIVPGKDGRLHRLSDFPVLPTGYESIRAILPPSKILHPDFEATLASAVSSQEALTLDGVVALIGAVSNEKWGPETPIPPEVHQALAETLVKLARSRRFAIRQDHLGVRFIPVYYRGGVVLYPPNARSEGQGSPEVFVRNRPEVYERDFIFPPEADDPPWLPRETRDAIRFLALPGVSDQDLERVCEMLNLFRLQEHGTPTNFVRHFLSPKGGSLFSIVELEKFLGVRDTRILVAQRKAYTHALKAYFRDAKTERFVKPADMGQVPCLYDTKGEWHPAGRFVRETSAASELLGYHLLSEDFRSWPPETLKALGVPLRPEASAFIAKVREYLLSPASNRPALSDLAALALSTEDAWGNDLAPLNRQAWLPVWGGRFEMPVRTLLASPENRNAVGESFPRMLSLADARPALRAQVANEPQSRLLERAAEIGICVTPSFADLVSVIDLHSQKKTPPPPGVFDMISQNPEVRSPRAVEGRRFFANGTWHPGTDILLSDDPRLPTVLGQSAVVLSAALAAPACNYLVAIGAQTQPTPAHFLEAIREVSRRAEEDPSIQGNRLRTLWAMFDESISLNAFPLLNRPEEFPDLLYPAPGRIIPVKQVIIPTQSGQIRPFQQTGWFGQWYVVPPGDPDSHLKALRRLGAREPSDLRPEDIASMLGGIGETKRTLTDAEALTVLDLLAVVASGAPGFRFENPSVWPVRDGSETRLDNASAAYVSDLPEALHLKQLGLPTILEASDPETNAAIRRLAQAQPLRPRLLSESLRRSFMQARKPREDREGSRRFALMFEALSALARRGEFPRGDFSWLAGARALTTSAISVRVDVEGSTIGFAESPACYIKESPGSPTEVYLCVEQSRLFDEVVAEVTRRCGITDTSTSTGQSRGSARQALLTLLLEPPNVWSQLFPGLPATDEYLPPLVSPDIEYKQGYVETREELLSEYGACQICGRRTPASASGDVNDTCETITSIISMRGGNYTGNFDRYELANTLFLCPSHQALYRRGLVRFRAVEQVAPTGNHLTTQEAARAAEALRHMAAQRGGNLGVSVFEVGEQADPKANPEPAWHMRDLRVTDEHASALLGRLADWMERGFR